MRLRRVALIVTLALSILSAPLVANAQPAAKVARIGFLSPATPPSPSTPSLGLEAFRRGLRNLGWVEGQNIVIEYRWAEGRLDRLPDLAAELIRLKVDVIVTVTTPAAQAAKQATGTIPIVMATGGDPVGSGLVTSLARPGANVTGLTHLAGLEIHGKRLELLKEAAPKISRVAVLWNPNIAIEARALKETQAQARTLGLTLVPVEVRSPNEFDGAFAALISERADALMAIENTLNVEHRRLIVDFAAQNRLATVFGLRAFVDAGGLISYATDFVELFRRSATYVDKVLKGAKPAGLPVEQPTRFELVINLKTAKALGLTIPQSILIRTDEVIQ